MPMRLSFNPEFQKNGYNRLQTSAYACDPLAESSDSVSRTDRLPLEISSETYGMNQRAPSGMNRAPPIQGRCRQCSDELPFPRAPLGCLSFQVASLRCWGHWIEQIPPRPSRPSPENLSILGRQVGKFVPACSLTLRTGIPPASS